MVKGHFCNSKPISAQSSKLTMQLPLVNFNAGFWFIHFIAHEMVLENIQSWTLMDMRSKSGKSKGILFSIKTRNPR
jgi:hypothetical protein